MAATRACKLLLLLGLFGVGSTAYLGSLQVQASNQLSVIGNGNGGGFGAGNGELNGVNGGVAGGNGGFGGVNGVNGGGNGGFGGAHVSPIITDDSIEALGDAIGGGGIPGLDYPILASVPDTGFSCDGQLPGYYADTAPEAGCQVFHICQEDGRIDSFLCPNGTVFNQQYFVCDWWYNFDCSFAQELYALNAEIGKVNGNIEGASFSQFGSPDGVGVSGSSLQGAFTASGGISGAGSSLQGAITSPAGGTGSGSPLQGSYLAPGHGTSGSSPHGSVTSHDAGNGSGSSHQGSFTAPGGANGHGSSQSLQGSRPASGVTHGNTGAPSALYTSPDYNNGASSSRNGASGNSLGVGISPQGSFTRPGNRNGGNRNGGNRNGGNRNGNGGQANRNSGYGYGK